MGTQSISEPELDRANHAKDASASVCELLAGELEPRERGVSSACQFIRMG